MHLPPSSHYSRGNPLSQSTCSRSQPPAIPTSFGCQPPLPPSPPSRHCLLPTAYVVAKPSSASSFLCRIRFCNSQAVANRRCRTYSYHRPVLFIPSSQPSTKVATPPAHSHRPPAIAASQPHPPLCSHTVVSPPATFFLRCSITGQSCRCLSLPLLLLLPLPLSAAALYLTIAVAHPPLAVSTRLPLLPCHATEGCS
ncbi:hypothetical protein B296_00029547 [Ensete ventricosum]|uniref:Uncharacterized protein n=1 Tax=Ensete ventricosum TaxID=4639 RepID=A0A426ZSI6_ENSVE|nr:hypothetical protein B296_00029547 [Ensete ventricosum]